MDTFAYCTKKCKDNVLSMLVRVLGGCPLYKLVVMQTFKKFLPSASSRQSDLYDTCR